jgi:RNA polymerase sporulation-specific sigma factor
MAKVTKIAKIGFYLEETNLRKYTHNNEELFHKLDEADEEIKPEIVSDIIENNLRLIHYIIKKRYPSIHTLCQSLRVTPDDFFSVGYYALMKAVYTFDITKGFKFATYATRTIHNEFGMFIRKHKRSFMVTSLSEVTYEGDSGAVDSEMTLMDLLADPLATHEEDYVHQEFGFIVMDELDRVLKPREMMIFRMYVSGGEDHLTQREIADILGISQSYISRLLKKTLDKARKVYNKLEKAG